MRTIGVVTVARSDYGIYLPVLKRIQADPELDLRMIVSGMHLSPEFGLTADTIESDGFEISERVEMLLSADTPEAISKSMGLGTIGFAQAYARERPDILVVLGDRFEMHAAAVAALPFNIPIAHIHGGESTEGAMDEQFRHSMTKMSHLHFASTQMYADRLVQMGEEPWRVTVSGAPSLDNIQEMRLLTREELQRQCALQLVDDTLLVTFHPVTLEYEDTETHVRELFAALREVGTSVVVTNPNADTGSRLVSDIIKDVTSQDERFHLVHNMGTQAYFSLMREASAMVGNSSSGIIEAACFKLPVVNIGNRQRGRMRGKNVIDVGHSRAEIVGGIATAMSEEFRIGLEDLSNPYGDGQAAGRIVEKLKSVPLDRKLLSKSFYSQA
jgi:UDP-hydrolysing UDP-N-acetyl-D-glucosamine 2-epimerase